MKMKSFAKVVMSGLMAASFAYVAPAMADDNSTDGVQNSQPAAMDNNVSQSAAMSTNNPQTPADMNSSGSGNADEGSPDTATGDDDY